MLTGDCDLPVYPYACHHRPRRQNTASNARSDSKPKARIVVLLVIICFISSLLSSRVSLSVEHRLQSARSPIAIDGYKELE